MGRASNNVPMMLGIAESNLFLPVFMILFLFYLADLNIISEVYDSWRTNFRKAGVLHEVLQPLGKWIYRSQNIYCSCVLSSPSSSSRDSVASRTPHLNLLLYSNFPPEQRWQKSNLFAQKSFKMAAQGPHMSIPPTYTPYSEYVESPFTPTDEYVPNPNVSMNFKPVVVPRACQPLPLFHPRNTL
jgi:hypothetical protein